MKYAWIRQHAGTFPVAAMCQALAKQLHAQHPRYKYRNMEITEKGLAG